MRFKLKIIILNHILKPYIEIIYQNHIHINLNRKKSVIRYLKYYINILITTINQSNIKLTKNIINTIYWQVRYPN